MIGHDEYCLAHLNRQQEKLQFDKAQSEKMDFKVFLKREWLEKYNEWMRGWDHCQGLPQISCRMSVRPSCPSFFPPPTPGQWPHNRTPKKEAQKGWDGISHFLYWLTPRKRLKKGEKGHSEKDRPIGYENGSIGSCVQKLFYKKVVAKLIC